MKQKQTITIIILFFFSVISLRGQETVNPITHEIKLQAGLSNVLIKDERLSANAKKSWASTFRIEYNKIDNTSKQEFAVSYTYRSKFDSEQLMDLTYHRPSFTYAYERRVGDSFVGGYFENSVLITLPRSKSGMFNNNPVSYSMFTSIGPKVSYASTLGQNNKVTITGSAQAALLNYNVRPAYGHPYPEKFLETGVFSPTRRGMAGPLMKSGKIQTIDKHQSFRLKLGAYYFVSEHIKVGLDVQFDYVHNNTLDHSTFQSTDILLGVGYVY